MIRFFTWHDIENFFEEKRLSWPESWNDVQIYKNEVIVYFRSDMRNEEEDEKYLKQIFTKNYDIQKKQIIVDFTGNRLNVFFEEDENFESRKRNYMPLFKDMYFKKYKDTEKRIFEKPIVAVHSYKGGVGRTLSMVALLRECCQKYPEKKILVIDADVEAPGLTWMLEEQISPQISYLDVLSLMHYEEMTKQCIRDIAELIKMSSITVTTDDIEVEQYFLPVYREKKQILESVSNSEKILYTQENKYYITETISRIGEELGAELIMVDLRAGVNEFSAPYLFDAGIIKYFVTSTSMQSVRGINQVMEQVYQKTQADLLKCKIFLTIIPPDMSQEHQIKIEDDILEKVEERFDSEKDTFLRENYIIRFNFDQSLIHIGNFRMLCTLLSGKGISEKMAVQAEELLGIESEQELNYSESEVRRTLERLYNIADAEITAEGNHGANMLVTSSIKELVKGFGKTVPRLVVPGAKGSGKTYIYKQLLAAKTWGNFEQFIEKTGKSRNEERIIVPLVASLNIKKMQNLLEENIKFIDSKFADFKIKKSIVNDNFVKLKNYTEQNIETQSRWNEIWYEVMLAPFGGKFQKIEELDEYLETEQKKLVYIVDGLEDLFMDAQVAGKPDWKFAIKGICQYVINMLENLDYGNIGIVIFARKDMLDEAIETNNEQFQNQYRKYELKWSQTEALRLVLWLAQKANPIFAQDVNILTATKDVLVEKLALLWGKKLGKNDSREAGCDRWILAALSDFNGQLQARDIVRFLKFSTRTYADVKLAYTDRFIMPSEIRKAIEPCSVKKLDEIKTEMKSVYAILEKFLKMEPTQKKLPMTLDKIALKGDEIARLEAQGYLKISDKKYYLPEIIRLSLGFSYEKGARPKVLSFLVQ